MARKYDVVGNIITWETKGLPPQKELKFFSHLVKTGQAWHLQGMYGRRASALIKSGFISPKGKILRKNFGGFTGGFV